jgi:hypothetical protein
MDKVNNHYSDDNLQKIVHKGSLRELKELRDNEQNVNKIHNLIPKDVNENMVSRKKSQILSKLIGNSERQRNSSHSNITLPNCKNISMENEKKKEHIMCNEVKPKKSNKELIILTEDKSDKKHNRPVNIIQIKDSNPEELKHKITPFQTKDMNSNSVIIFSGKIKNNSTKKRCLIFSCFS